MAGTPTEPVPTPSQAAATATPGAGPRPPDGWAEDLAPIGEADWNDARARHLLDRAGFGGTPEAIARLAGMPPAAAVASLVDYHAIDNGHLKPFEPSGIYDPTLTPFPPTRPAATRLAAETGMAMGIAVKPAGPRRLQPVADRFFFWLRASALETRRIANWWADRMVATNRPLEEKMALFWHGHFATGSDKVRDYRKMLGQLALFQRLATGSFRELLVGVAQDPAMLVFLDAGQNVKRAPNENFGREVMELFTMGVGNYYRAGHPRGRARLHRLGRRRPDVPRGQGQVRRRGEDLSRPHRPVRRRADPGHHPRTGRHRHLHRRQALPLPGPRGHLAGLPAAARRAAARARLRDRAVPAHHLPLTRLLQRRLGRHPRQGAGGTHHLHLPPARAHDAAGRAGFQRGERRARAGAAQPAHRRRLGTGARLDHARLAAGARQLRARCRAARHDRLRRPEPAADRSGAPGTTRASSPAWTSPRPPATPPAAWTSPWQGRRRPPTC